jgi:hypothetical protein
MSSPETGCGGSTQSSVKFMQVNLKFRIAKAQISKGL